MTTDTSEYGLESLICTALTVEACAPPKAGEVREPVAGYGGVGWSCGSYPGYLIQGGLQSRGDSYISC